MKAGEKEPNIRRRNEVESNIRIEVEYHRQLPPWRDARDDACICYCVLAGNITGKDHNYLGRREFDISFVFF